MRNRWPTLFNHQARKHNESDLELYRLLRAGETAKDAVKKYARDDLMRYGLDSFTDKYRKLIPHRAAPTLVAHLAKDANMFIHPRDNRGLTVREAARLQGIHDDFVLLGNLCEQFVQVGNAVPPRIAEEVSRALLPSHGGVA
jgi:DNA (cytosine-5)-methyltransferase 1